MIISPYLHFRGECAEAIQFYEEAFGVKATVYRYGDALSEAEVDHRNQGLVAHAYMDIYGQRIYLCDGAHISWHEYGSNVALQILVDHKIDVVALHFKLGKDYVQSSMPRKVPWADYYCAVEDKFGVCWIIQTSG